jgi:hypothetical protein
MTLCGNVVYSLTPVQHNVTKNLAEASLPSVALTLMCSDMYELHTTCARVMTGTSVLAFSAQAQQISDPKHSHTYCYFITIKSLECSQTRPFHTRGNGQCHWPCGKIEMPFWESSPSRVAVRGLSRSRVLTFCSEPRDRRGSLN